MISQFDNNLNMSFYLWAENRMANLAQAYVNTTLPFYYAPDSRLPPQLLSYSSPFKQFVYDSGVSGAVIINSVSGSAGVLTRTSGIYIDYDNGRVIVPASLGTNLTLTGSMAVKAINIYQPNETEEFIITQGKFFFNPRYIGTATGGGVPPYQMATPAMFINTLHSDDQAFALGGLDDTTTTMSISVVAESNFQLNATLSLMRDARYKYFPLLNVSQDPINQWGDLVGGTGFNYTTVTQTFGNPGQLVYIKSVKTSKVSDRVKMNPEYFVGLIDIECSYVRLTQ